MGISVPADRQSMAENLRRKKSIGRDICFLGWEIKLSVDAIHITGHPHSASAVNPVMAGKSTPAPGSEMNSRSVGFVEKWRKVQQNCDKKSENLIKGKHVIRRYKNYFEDAVETISYRFNWI